ncbi:MAG: PAS domain-containing protein [Polyangiaceae bacterium]|nr:PAS domain-containing protein [Polyangiaceae bacterium]
MATTRASQADDDCETSAALDGLGALRTELEQWRTEPPASSAENVEQWLERVAAIRRQVELLETERVAEREKLAVAYRAVDLERRKHRELLDAMGEACFLTDRLTTIHAANSAATLMLGVSFNTLRAKPLSAFVARSSLSTLYSAIEQLPNQGVALARVALGNGAIRSARVVLRGTLLENLHQALWICTEERRS